MSPVISSMLILAFAQSVFGACSVPGISGSYSRHLVADFSGKSAADGHPESYLNSAGFGINQFEVINLGASWQRDTVAFVDGALEMTVRAQEGVTRPSAEITTLDPPMLYGSMRTVMKSSTTAGICEGMFFYANDNAEIDWEILTHNKAIWATNRKATNDSPVTNGVYGMGQDPSADFHEYRIDWDPTKTVFYIDGVHQTEFVINVPQIPGLYMVNVWSNGVRFGYRVIAHQLKRSEQDPAWSAGPPLTDSRTLVKSIEIFTGYAPGESEETCTTTLDGTPPVDPITTTEAVIAEPVVAALQADPIPVPVESVQPSANPCPSNVIANAVVMKAVDTHGAAAVSTPVFSSGHRLQETGVLLAITAWLLLA